MLCYSARLNLGVIFSEQGNLQLMNKSVFSLAVYLSAPGDSETGFDGIKLNKLDCVLYTFFVQVSLECANWMWCQWTKDVKKKKLYLKMY